MTKTHKSKCTLFYLLINKLQRVTEKNVYSKDNISTSHIPSTGVLIFASLINEVKKKGGGGII